MDYSDITEVADEEDDKKTLEAMDNMRPPSAGERETLNYQFKKKRPYFSGFLPRLLKGLIWIFAFVRPQKVLFWGFEVIKGLKLSRVKSHSILLEKIGAPGKG